MRNYIPDTQQCSLYWYSYANNSIWSYTDDWQLTLFFTILRNFQAYYCKIFGSDIYEVDLSLCFAVSTTILCKGDYFAQFCSSTYRVCCRACFSDYLRDIYNLFPYPYRSENSPPDTCEHVLIRAAYSRHCCKYIRRYG